MFIHPYYWADCMYDNKYCIIVFAHDQDGKVVCIKIKDWLPFFYIKHKTTSKLNSEQAEQILDKISTNYIKYSIESRKEIYYHEAKVNDLIKVSFRNAKDMVAFFYKAVEGKEVDCIEYYYPHKRSKEIIPQIKKFQVELDITYTCWLEISSPCDKAERKLSTETEYDISWKSIKKTDKIFQYDHKVLFFDLETFSSRLSSSPGKPGLEDEIFQNSITFMHGKEIKKKIMQVVLGKCSKFDLEDCEVRFYENDEQLILDWCEIVKELKPTVISHFNGNKFDLPYMDARLTIAGQKWSNAGKIIKHEAKFHTSSFTNSANYDGGVVRTFIDWPGILWVDMFRFVKANYGDKLKMFSLDKVLEYFLKKGKVDFPWQLINMTYRLAKGIDWYQHAEFMQKLADNVGKKTGKKYDINEESQEFIDDSMKCCAEYCLGDVIHLPELFNHLKVMMRLSEEANILGVDIDNIHTGNSSSKANVLFYKYAKRTGRYLMIPLNLNIFKYKGGNVIDPREKNSRGVHFFVPTFDFTGMYPGIIMEENICMSTLIKYIKEYNGDMKYVKEIISDTPEGGKRHSYWYQGEEGFIPLLLKEIKKERDYYKKLAKEHKGTMLGDIYEERQLALKKIMNSVYGLLGRKDGGMGLMEAAEAVTHTGREDQALCVTIAEEKVELNPNGVEVGNFKIIYGDTDSVMGVKPGRDPKLLIEDAKAVIKKINSHFKGYKSLDYEKTILIIYLDECKTYKYIVYDGTIVEMLDFTKASSKGLSSKKRDTPVVAGYIQDRMIETVLQKYWSSFFKILYRPISEMSKEDIKKINDEINKFYNSLIKATYKFVEDLHKGKHDNKLSKIMVYTGNAKSETCTPFRFAKAMIEEGIELMPGDRFEVFLCDVPDKKYVGEKLKTKELIEKHGYKYDYIGYEKLIYKKANKILSIFSEYDFSNNEDNQLSQICNEIKKIEINKE